MTSVKVWRVNDFEWWAGESWEEVERVYLKETGLPADEAFEEPELLPPAEMEELEYMVQEKEFPGVEAGGISFRQALELMLARRNSPGPFLFASTDW